nr:immunoglobulin heavy chain junction region [Mus musculus]
CAKAYGSSYSYAMDYW